MRRGPTLLGAPDGNMVGKYAIKLGQRTDNDPRDWNNLSGFHYFTHSNEHDLLFFAIRLAMHNDINCGC
jgi:hypothetical protein